MPCTTSVRVPYDDGVLCVDTHLRAYLASDVGPEANDSAARSVAELDVTLKLFNTRPRSLALLLPPPLQTALHTRAMRFVQCLVVRRATGVGEVAKGASAQRRRIQGEV